MSTIKIIIILVILSVSVLNAENKTAVVLSGGGVRGTAHIGVLKALEEYNIKPDFIVGTSIGALIGGLYAVGYNANQIDSIFNEINWNSIIRLGYENKRQKVFYYEKDIEDKSILSIQFNNFKFVPRESISTGNLLNEFIRKYILASEDYYAENDFDKLKIPFRAVATDLAKGGSVAIKSGNLAQVLKACISIPGYFSPVRVDDMILVDGGIMANLPVRFAVEYINQNNNQNDKWTIIASNTTTPIYSADALKSTIIIADQVLSISMNYFVDNDKLLTDIIITPDFNENINASSYLDFSNFNEYIEVGYKSAKKELKNIYDVASASLNFEAASTFDQIFDRSFELNSGLNFEQSFVDSNSGDTVIGGDFIKEVANMFKDAVFVFNNTEHIIITDFDVIINKERVDNWKKIITSAFPVQIGDTLSNKLLSDCYNFLETNILYKDISIQILEDKMRISITEGDNQTLRLSGNLDNENYAHLGINFLTKGVLSKNNNVNLILEASNINRHIGFSIFNSRIFESQIAFKFDVYYNWNDIFVYKKHQVSRSFNYEIIDTNYTKKRGLQVAFGSMIGRDGLINVTYRLENQAFGRLIDVEKNDKDNNVSLFGIALKYDTEDMPFFARSGCVLDVSLETNLFSINEYTKFSKIITFIKYNISNGKHTLSPSLFFGIGDRTLPYPEMFSLGGQNNFFGMREKQELGRQMFRLSVDYRYNLPSYLSILSKRSFVSLRYDFGSIWELPEDIKLSTLRHGVGVSYSVSTAIGPFSISLGRAFNFIQDNDALKYIRWGNYMLYFNLGVRI